MCSVVLKYSSYSCCKYCLGTVFQMTRAPMPNPVKEISHTGEFRVCLCLVNFYFIFWKHGRIKFVCYEAESDWWSSESCSRCRRWVREISYVRKLPSWKAPLLTRFPFVNRRLHWHCNTVSATSMPMLAYFYFYFFSVKQRRAPSFALKFELHRSTYYHALCLYGSLPIVEENIDSFVIAWVLCQWTTRGGRPVTTSSSDYIINILAV